MNNPHVCTQKVERFLVLTRGPDSIIMDLSGNAATSNIIKYMVYVHYVKNENLC